MYLIFVFILFYFSFWRLNDNICCGVMAESEDVVRKNSIMDSDVVVCISDDEDQGDNNVGAAKSKTKSTSYNSNVSNTGHLLKMIKLIYLHQPKLI